MTLLVDFSDIDSTMINAVGGKALNLGIMSSARLPVPTGFCVTTAAYRLVIADRLDDLMGKLADATDPGGVAAAAEEAPSVMTRSETKSLRAQGSRSPYAHRQRLKIWRTRALPASRIPTSTLWVRLRCSMRSGAAGRHCGPIVPSAIAMPMRSITTA